MTESSAFNQSSVTFVLPNFNHCDYLHKSLSALFNQTQSAEKIIIIDDASTDDSDTVIRTMIRGRKDVSYIRNRKNRGVIACLNQGLDLTDTEFVAFPGADDCLDERFISLSVPLLRQHDEAALSVARICVKHSDGTNIHERPAFPPAKETRYISPEEFARIITVKDNFLIGQVALYRTAVLREIAGGFDAHLSSLCDGMVMRVMAARHGFCFVNEILGVWHKHGGNFSVESALDPQNFQSTLEQARETVKTAPENIFPSDYDAILVRRMSFDAARILLESKRYRIGSGAQDGDSVYGMYLKIPNLFRAVSVLPFALRQFVSLALLYLMYRPYPLSTVVSFLIRRLRPWVGFR